MKRLVTMIAIAAPSAAGAHEVGLSHLHPHPDPLFLAWVVALLGGVALIAWLRGSGS